ncbi:MAG: hypothetical protein JKY66_09750 [Spongiibacteraceae bacterium]|nr:hypothetical protein [Spongiibacteraceae bacterium]
MWISLSSLILTWVLCVSACLSACPCCCAVPVVAPVLDKIRKGQDAVQQGQTLTSDELL